MRTGLIIYNPKAGRLSVRPFIRGAAKALRRAGWKIRIARTQSGEHAIELAQQAAEQGLTAAFAVGGDGTLGQVANGLAGSDTALGILPSGTVNVLAEEFGLPKFNLWNLNALRANASLLAEAPIHSLDLGEVNGYQFVLWAGIGLDALAIHALEPRLRVEKFFAFPEYAAAAILKAQAWHGVRLQLWADGVEVQGHYMLAVANNVRTYMGGMAVLSPDACLDDGFFDLWLFSGETLTDVFRHAFDMWSGRHIESEHIQRLPFRSLRVRAETPVYLQADGEPLPAAQEVEIRVRPRALKVLMPPKGLSLLSAFGHGTED
jgi:YegS/Rv2252/BmrU family lipid kinase